MDLYTENVKKFSEFEINHSLVMVGEFNKNINLIDGELV
jgi:hypothetical protein